VRLVRDSEERDLTVTTGHGQVVGGYLLVVRDDVLLAQRMDEGTRTLQERGSAIASGVGVTSTGRNLFAASSRIVLSAAYSPRARELAWFDMNGMRTATAGEGGDFWQVRLSPDDQHAAVTFVAPLLRTLDVFIVPAASGRPIQPLTLALAADSDPVWSPDGRRVVFKSLQTGRPALFMKRAHDGNAEDEPFVDGDATPTDWLGSNVIVQAADPASGYDIVAIDEARHTRTLVVKSGFNDTDGRWSPNGAWLAFVSNESGRPDVYAVAREGGRVRVSFSGGTRPRWTRDGRSLIFLRGSAIMRATLASGSPASFSPAVQVLEAPGIRDFDVAHRRDALLAIVPVGARESGTVSAIVDWQSTIR
jgi:dipeptidyl aminopeptidase/acylaminoacyl peptidase